MNLEDTIAAISTPPGRGGLGVVRISGTLAKSVAGQILRFRRPPDWKPWRAHAADLVDEDGRTVDQVVVIFYAAPRSYTAEDVVEVCCHGAPVVLRFALHRACAAGARPAEPGEFTLRAYLNGRIDLSRAEAVRDLIEATTLYQAKVAAQQVDGSVSLRLAPLKEQLVELIALLEAGIDFAEDDVAVAADEEIARRLEPILKGVDSLVASFSFGKLVHDGFSLAIVGRPNVGKSSLFNCLLEQDRAIVTEIAGTTRDLVSEQTALDGIPVRCIDTAGIREGKDIVERLGIERSYQAMADADLTLVVLDLSEPLAEDDHRLLERARAQGRRLVAGNKSDLPRAAGEVDCVPVSALTGFGIDQLRKRILESFAAGGRIGQDEGFITSIRHERLLNDCRAALTSCAAALGQGLPHEMLLLDLYEALHALDEITGATTADDILNRIFATFCIGK